MRKVFHLLDQVSSTQTFCKSLRSSKRPEVIDIVVADGQSAGKGQAQKSWYFSKDSSIALSVGIAQLKIPVAQAFGLHCIVTRAVGRVLSAHYPDISLKLKWPNDLYVEHQKIGGILTYNVIQGKEITETVIGLGLNVKAIQFPSSLPNPGSIEDFSAQTCEITDLRVHLAEAILQDLQEKTPSWDALLREYNQLLYRRGEEVELLYQGNKISAIVNGVCGNGRLEVLHNEQLRQFDFGEVSWILT